MLNKLSILIIFTFLVSFSVCHAETIGKVSIDDMTKCSGQALPLNGAGIRKKLFIKLYVAALYVQTKSSDEKQLLNMSQSLCMRLHIISSKITSKKMIKATREGFEKSTQGNTAGIAEEIETFLAWLEQPIKKGDVFEFSSVPNNSTAVFKDNQILGRIDNQQLASALFRIWLGSSPAQLDLKNKLLGD